MTIQRVLHLNQNVSLHHRLSSSPFLCFFSSSSSSCFFGTLAKGRFLPFRSKKEKEREELFFTFLVLSFLVLSRRLWKRQKKRELFFFFYNLTRTNKRTRIRRWDWKVRQEEESKKTTLDWRRYFSFFVVSFCVLVFDQDVVSFREEREREKGTTKKPKRKNSLLGSKKSVSHQIKKNFFLFSVPKTLSRQRTEGGYKIFWIGSKTFLTQL